MKKFKNYAFWVALAGAIVVFLENLESMLGISIDESLVESLILSFCGILVVLGIVTKTDDDSDVNTLPNEKDLVDNIDMTDVATTDDVPKTEEKKTDEQIGRKDPKEESEVKDTDSVKK